VNNLETKVQSGNIKPTHVFVLANAYKDNALKWWQIADSFRLLAIPELETECRRLAMESAKECDSLLLSPSVFNPQLTGDQPPSPYAP
jgi:hypothetical protein